MAEAIQKGWQGFRFRRTLHGETLGLWNNLRSRSEDIEMKGGKDKITWSLNANGIFTVKSLYKKMVDDGLRFPQKFLWKIKLQQKLRFSCG